MFKGLFQTKKNTPKAEIVWDLTDIDLNNIPKHIAIIMDGNGRWAKAQGKVRTFGHQAGAETLKTIVRAADKLGVKVISAYAFSTENWSRPSDEVEFLMKAFVKNIDKYTNKLIKNKTRVLIIGERTNLPSDVLETINKIEGLTKEFTNYTLGICFNYGGKQEIIHATKTICKKVVDGEISIDDINVELMDNHLYTAGIEPVDLMIRTSGEQRLSNFLPWQLAYSEFIFTACYWPDFNKKELYECIDLFQSRNRRFGGLVNKNAE